MGPQPSALPNAGFIRPYSDDMYIPVGGSRMNDERAGSELIPSPKTKCKTIHRAYILKTGFCGIWSVTTSNTLGPCPRTGHFFCHDESNQKIYIGYGLAQNDVPMDDFWELDTVTLNWRRVPLKGDKVSPRSGTKACLVGRRIVLFGGYSDPNYFADLHTIEIDTGIVTKIQTNGYEPSPRSSPIVGCYNNKYFVWGGFNGEWPNELNILDLNTMTWRQIQNGISGRTSIPFVQIGDTLYCYGGSKSAGMLCLNMDKEEITIKECIGAPPPSQSISAGMVQVEKYLFYFGGKLASNSNKWTLMYACDVTKMWWFVFHIIPDGESVSIIDGSISDSGLFMLPRIHSFGVSYIKEKRTIMAFLGYPLKDPPSLFSVYIGEAMSIIHHREDMISVLKGEK